MARRKEIEKGDPVTEIQLKSGVVYRVRMSAGKDENGKQRQICRTFDNYPDAEAYVAEVRYKRKTGEFVHPKDAKKAAEKEAGEAVLLADFIDSWLDGLHDLEPTTVHGYRSVLRPVVGAYGQAPVAALTKAQVDALVRERSKTGGRNGDGVSPRTIRFMLVVLSAALGAARKQGIVQVNVAELVRPPKAAPQLNGEQRAWRADEAAAFLRHVADDRYAALWMLSLHGLRRGEVLGLRWSSVDLDEGILTVRESRVLVGGQVHQKASTKTDKSRDVPLTPAAVAALMQFRLRQELEATDLGIPFDPDGLVAVNEALEPLRPEAYGKAFGKHVKDAGLRRIRLHDLRHTTASLMVNAGEPLSIVADVLGHDVQTLIATYAHTYETAKRKAVGTLAGLLGEEVAA